MKGRTEGRKRRSVILKIDLYGKDTFSGRPLEGIKREEGMKQGEKAYLKTGHGRG